MIQNFPRFCPRRSAELVAKQCFCSRGGLNIEALLVSPRPVSAVFPQSAHQSTQYRHPEHIILAEKQPPSARKYTSPPVQVNKVSTIPQQATVPVSFEASISNKRGRLQFLSTRRVPS
jgi:hypothetical protein